MRRFATREPAIAQLPGADARAAPPGPRHPLLANIGAAQLREANGLDLARPAVDSLKRAEGFAEALRSAGVPALLNPWALTVVFPKPSERLVAEYELACHGGLADAMVMPNVKADLIERFVEANEAEWRFNVKQ